MYEGVASDAAEKDAFDLNSEGKGLANRISIKRASIKSFTELLAHAEIKHDRLVRSF